MAAFDETPILELGKGPIPGANPCGSDASEHPDNLLVQAEIGKLDRIEAGPPEWPAVEQAAINILQGQSKDVEVACVLGLALFQRAGYAGLASWLGMIKVMVEAHWDGLFPERPRRRKARIEFVCDRFTDGGWFRERPPKDDDFDALDLSVTRLAELETLLAAKMPGDAPDFKKFSRGLKELCAKRPKLAGEGQTAAPPSGQGVSAGPAGAAFAAGEIADRGSALSAVLGAAAFLRKADAADPVPYALVRAIKWSKIELPTTDAGKYQIDPPEASTVEALEHQFTKQLWENLLKNAEAAFRTADPLWLDVQRYVASALRGLGAGYEKAYHAVVSATGGLVRRLGPGLYELKFKNGRPLCAGETRMWIESEVSTGPAAGSASQAVMNGQLNEAWTKARQLVAAGKLSEAVGALQSGLTACTQRRERFLWRLRIAQLCFEAQRPQLAGPLLEECYQEVQRYGIHEWEPALAVDVAQTLYRCRKSLLTGEKTPSPATIEKVRDTFAWLCQLDPVAALAAEPAGS
jgi:type VI secretion system protein VasJ